MRFIKWLWGKHRLDALYLICVTSTCVVVFIGCVVNAFIESMILRHVLDVITITLNFTSAWFVWRMYVRHFKRYYKEFADDYPDRIKRYKFLQTMRDDFMKEYPDQEPLPELPRPTNLSRSYGKSRWIYYIGIAINILVGLFNILTW